MARGKGRTWKSGQCCQLLWSLLPRFIFFASVMVGAMSSMCGTKVSTPVVIWVEGFSSAKYLSMCPRVIKEKIFNKWRQRSNNVHQLRFHCTVFRGLEQVPKGYNQKLIGLNRYLFLPESRQDSSNTEIDKAKYLALVHHSLSVAKQHNTTSQKKSLLPFPLSLPFLSLP